jgi:hypothetical protein
MALLIVFRKWMVETNEDNNENKMLTIILILTRFNQNIEKSQHILWLMQKEERKRCLCCTSHQKPSV